MLISFLRVYAQRIGVNLGKPLFDPGDADASIEYVSIPEYKYPADAAELSAEGPACAKAWMLLESNSHLPDTYLSNDDLGWIFHTSTCVKTQDTSECWQVILVAVADPRSWIAPTSVRQEAFDRMDAKTAMTDALRSNKDPGNSI